MHQLAGCECFSAVKEGKVLKEPCLYVTKPSKHVSSSFCQWRWISVYWTTCETGACKVVVRYFPSINSSNTSPSVHMNFLFWPCLVTRRRKRLPASFLTLTLIWLQDQKHSGEFLPDFSHKSFHVASLAPAPWSTSLCSHDMFTDMFLCGVSHAANRAEWGLDIWRKHFRRSSATCF